MNYFNALGKIESCKIISEGYGTLEELYLLGLFDKDFDIDQVPIYGGLGRIPDYKVIQFWNPTRKDYRQFFQSNKQPIICKAYRPQVGHAAIELKISEKGDAFVSIMVIDTEKLADGGKSLPVYYNTHFLQTLWYKYVERNNIKFPKVVIPKVSWWRKIYNTLWLWKNIKRERK